MANNGHGEKADHTMKTAQAQKVTFSISGLRRVLTTSQASATWASLKQQSTKFSHWARQHAQMQEAVDRVKLADFVNKRHY